MSKSECKRINVLKGRPMMEGIEDTPASDESTDDSRENLVKYMLGDSPLYTIEAVTKMVMEHDEIYVEVRSKSDITDWSLGSVEEVIKLITEKEAR